MVLVLTEYFKNFASVENLGINHKDIIFFKNSRHMKDHMEVPIDTSNMSEQELQFHYFKMHDSDGNNKLDGCELVKSLIHWHGKQYIYNK